MWIILLVIVFIVLGILGADWESRKATNGTKQKLPLLGEKSKTVLQIIAFIGTIGVFILLSLPSKQKEEYVMTHEDSLSYNEMVTIDTMGKSASHFPRINIENDYKIITTDHAPTTENYHLFLTKKKHDVEYLQSIVTSFRQQHCNKQCNIYLYDQKLSPRLVTQYPIPNSDYLNIADHFVAQSTFEDYTVWMYPFQDFHYKELGGKNWKKKPIQ